MHGLWKEFGRLTSGCYGHLSGMEENAGAWDEAYAVLVEIVRDGRSRDSGYAAELYQLDEQTDYRYDVDSWLEDYLDMLDMGKRYGKLRQVCTELIGLFQWEEEKPSELRFLIASSLQSEGKKEEALAYCEDWYKKESDDMTGATALIYARTAAGDFNGAEQIVNQYISEDGVCTDENDIVYTAAERLYKASGNKKAEKWVKKALKKYEDELEAYYSGMDEDGLDFSLDDIEDEDYGVLPF